MALKSTFIAALERMAERGLPRAVIEAEDNPAEGGCAYELNGAGTVELHDWCAWGGGESRRPSPRATKHLRGLLAESNPLEMSLEQLRLAHRLGVDWRESVGPIGTRGGCRDGLQVEEIGGVLQLVRYGPGRAPDGTPSGYRVKALREIGPA